MDVIVIDFKTIYVVSISENADRDAVLAAYMRKSGEGWRNNQGELYNYWTTKQSGNIYTIRRQVNKTDEFADELIMYMLIAEIDIADWWAQAYPIIAQTASVTGAVTGIAVIASAPFVFIKWVRKKFQSKKGKDEYICIQYVLKKDAWNVSELSESLSISNEQAKDLLRGIGFVWNRHKMLYVSTEITEKFREIKPKKYFN